MHFGVRENPGRYDNLDNDNDNDNDNELLPRWLEREPDNPYVAALVPLIIPRAEDLRVRAPQAWQVIRAAPLAPPIRATLERMLECWLMERFPLLTDEELRTMFPVLVPLEQTRAYQDIFAKGKAEGEAKGEVKGKADGLKRLLKRRFGVLPRWAVRRLDQAAIDQLDGWLEGIFEAQSVEGLLGPRPRRGMPKVPQASAMTPTPRMAEPLRVPPYGLRASLRLCASA